MKNEFIMPINRKQILLDWINTIDEPQCLLVSDLEHLVDGGVFMEILKNYLKQTRINKELLLQIKNGNFYENEDKFNLIFYILNQFIDKEVLQNFLPFEMTLNNSNLLLQFIQLVKSLFEGEKDEEEEKINFSNDLCYNNNGKIINNDNHKIFQNNNLNENNFKIIDEDQIYNYEILESIEKFTKKPKIEGFIKNEDKFKNNNYVKKNIPVNPINLNLKKNYESDLELSDDNINIKNNSNNSLKFNEKKLFESPHNKYKTDMKTKIKKEIGITNSNFDIIVNNSKLNLNENSIIKQENNKTFISKINSNKKYNFNDKEESSFSVKLNLNNLNVLNNINKNNISISHDYNNILNQSITNFNNNNSTITDYNKIYSKREIAELSLFRGIPLINKLNILELKDYQVGYFKYLKPSSPIINVDYNNLIKYEPSAEFVKNSIISNKIKENDEKLMKNTDRSNISQISKNNKIKEDNRSKSKQNNEISESTLTTIQTKDFIKIPILPSQDGISSTLKNKIYFWLIDLNILKENSIKADDLPNLCANGVLLSDLVNRLEGRSETIKGIIRKTTTKSHVQVNINKVLQHLRNIQKFNTRHLWSNSEISSADPKTIWEFLDDIWHFYSNKNNLIKNDVLRRKSKNENFRKTDMSNLSKSPSRVNNSKIISNSNSNNNLCNFNKNKENNEQLNTLNNNENSELNFNENKNNSFKEFQKTILNNFSEINSNRSKTKENKNNNESFVNNINVIANCLGMNNKMAIKKQESSNNIKEKINSKILITNESKINENKSKLNNSKCYSDKKVKNNLNFTLNQNLNLKTESNVNTNNNSAKKENNCFVIFKKSNAKKLQKEIERYDQNVSNSNINNKLDDIIKDDINNKNRFLLNKNEESFEAFFKLKKEKENICNEPQILLTEESSKINNFKQKTILHNNEDNNINDWLYALGIKYNFKDFIIQFKNGIILSEIISILENKKITGINPNPRTNSACIKNILKSLEVLRNRKVN